MLFVCMGKTRFGGIIWGEVVMMHVFPISMYFFRTDHTSMSAQLLAPSTSVFYLRGTTNERVPATIMGSLSKVDCVAIQYEQSMCISTHGSTYATINTTGMRSLEWRRPLLHANP